MQTSKWDRGIQFIQRGCDRHEEGDAKGATQFYERGIQLLIDHVRTMPSSTRKLEKQQQIESYLTLLADLKPNKNQFTSPSPPAQPQQKQNKKQASRRQYPHVSEQKQQYKPPPKKRNKHDQELYSRIEEEIIATNPNVSFNDVVGLDNVKQALLEAVILPAQRPDIFTGPRAPPKGLLLFGPPGNGKTFIAKALASECKATFFCISSSSLTSRYVGEGEKLVRALFECARDRAPSIIFIDEIDSLLTSRGQKDEQESSRRMKTEFLIQFDGVQSGDNEQQRVLLVGATNLPWELDDAALRRFPKRILVNKPDGAQRRFLIDKMLCASKHGQKLNVKMSDMDMQEVVRGTDGYSASDIKNLVNDAAMGPIRDVGMDILNTKNIPPVTMKHFRESLQNIKPSTTKEALVQFQRWNAQFGTKLNVKKFKQAKQSQSAKSEEPELSKAKSSSSWFSMF
mmetsp:Transcript_72921/g.116311  ORF Transcript_72921/g.116311 Transcript_72921/m.116311 type:complete len:455 (-) Transcript_72921:166-1530(-)